MNLKQYKNNYLLSNQYKKALFFAFLEAKNNGLTALNPTCLLYGLLKVNSSLGSLIFKRICNSKSLSKDTILTKLKFLLKQQGQRQSLKSSQELPLLSKSARQIILSSILQSKSDIITTDDLFLALISNEKLQKQIVSLIFEI